MIYWPALVIGALVESCIIAWAFFNTDYSK